MAKTRTKKKQRKKTGKTPIVLDDRPILSVIKDIQNGTLSPKLLTPEDRQRCVELLTTRGYAKSEIAQIMEVNDRTISRDRRKIREKNAVDAGPQFTAEAVGSLILGAEAAISMIQQVVRVGSTPPAVKIDGIKACWDILRERTQLLQRLGYLPTAAQEIKGDLVHHVVEVPKMDDLNEEFQRVLTICENTQELDEENRQQLAQIKKDFSQLEMGEQLQMIRKLLPKGTEDE